MGVLVVLDTLSRCRPEGGCERVEGIDLRSTLNRRAIHEPRHNPYEGES